MNISKMTSRGKVKSIIYSNVSYQFIVPEKEELRFIKEMKEDGFDVIDEDEWDREEVCGYFQISSRRSDIQSC